MAAILLFIPAIHAQRLPLSSAERYRFQFRGDTITYDPYAGSSWSRPAKKTAHDYQRSSAFASSREVANLSRSCLLYACAKAEEIQRGAHPGLSDSRVIGFASFRGKHAILLYRKGGAFFAEDHRQFPVHISAQANGALSVAREFVAKTSGGRDRVPMKAYLIGSR